MQFSSLPLTMYWKNMMIIRAVSEGYCVPNINTMLSLLLNLHNDAVQQILLLLLFYSFRNCKVKAVQNGG